MNDDANAIVITGAGVVSPAGTGVEAFWAGICSGRSFARDISTDGRTMIGCDVVDESWLADFRHSERRRLDRVCLMGQYALGRAAADGGIEDLDVKPERLGLVVGTGYPAVITMTQQWDIYRRLGPTRMSPFAIATTMPSTVAAFGTQRLGIRGHVLTVSSACASGAQAILEGARLLRDGSVDAVLAGGAEAPLDEIAVAAFHRMEVLSRRFDDPSHASRPFDTDRDGFVLGEGAGFVLMTSRERAEAAGVPMLAELAGWGVTCDAHHISAPDPEGVAAEHAVRRALDRAGLEPTDIGHVNGHGTGTRLNDLAEAVAYRRVFGEDTPPVTSLKGAMGHLMGAAGAVELIGSVLSYGHGAIPPTANCTQVDPSIGLDIVTAAPRALPPQPFLSSSFAFGGINVALIARPARQQ